MFASLAFVLVHFLPIICFPIKPALKSLERPSPAQPNGLKPLAPLTSAIPMPAELHVHRLLEILPSSSSKTRLIPYLRR
jgi:hypothetical protein